MIIEPYEDWWTDEPYPEELTEEVEEKKIKTIFSHKDKRKLSTDE